MLRYKSTTDFYVLVIFYLISSITIVKSVENLCHDRLVELTISPLVSESRIRELQISWSVPDWQEGDWISLSIGPTFNQSEVRFTKSTNSAEGWVSTGISENRHFRDPDYSPTCLGYWTAYFRPGYASPLVYSCLKTNPRWMEEMRPDLDRLMVRDMFLPGTHDSAAFQIAFVPFRLTRYAKYTFAQDETIMEQLIHGARYLDLRVGIYDNIFWANHGIAKVHPMEHVLLDIKEFVNATKEIVVLDFHNFPVGFKDRKAHDKLVNYLKQELGSYLVSTHLSWSVTAGDIWNFSQNTKKRIILAYNDREMVNKYSDVLFPPVTQKWANVRSIDKLKAYLADFLAGRKPSYPWSAMAELTPNTWTVLTDKQGGLRSMAYSTNPEVTKWFRGDWGGKCNAVAVDFLRSSGIVEAAIKWNRRRANGVFSCKGLA